MIQKTPLQEETLANYQQMAEKYFWRETTSKGAAWILEDFSHLKPGGRVLDIGGGNGWVADLLEENGFTVERTEAVQSFVDYQMQQGKEASLLDIITDDITPDMYDAIYMASVLHHFTREQLPAILQKIYKGLKIGGVFIFRTKSGEGEEFVDSNEGVPAYYCYWTIDTIKPLLQDAHFEIEKLEVAGPKHILGVIRK